MAFTGDLEHLPIADIIQLVHTTRKSGIFSVKEGTRESNIVFSNGSIVGANHINDSVRIGTVLVKMGAITIDDLRQALDAAKNDIAHRKPLMAALMQMGKLKREDARRGLKKLVEMTIVELMNWTKGTFTFDTDTVVYSPEGGDSSGDPELDVGIDAQMVLMDALRLFDERERDRANGKEVPSFEALYADVFPGERTGETKSGTTITADVLGLADLERLEKKIPRPVSEMEIFDPVEIHRQKIKELLAGFSFEEQETFVSFLRKSLDHKVAPGAAAQQAGKALVLFSNDKLIRHAVMTICKEEGLPVFSTEDETELEGIISQCLSAARMPVVVFDSPSGSENGFPERKIIDLRNRVREKYSAVPLLQLSSPQENNFILQSYGDGIRAVIPKPLKEIRRAAYVQDTIHFLNTLKLYIKGLQERPDNIGRYVKELKNDIKSLRETSNPSDAALTMLSAVAGMFERAVTFLVRPSELTGERAIGVSSEKSMGPTQADRLKIPISKPSVFREVLEKGQVFYGESSDEMLRGLFQEIGKPLSPVILLLPLISDRKVVAIVYGDFGKKEAYPVQLDILEILAQQVGLVLEYGLFRRQMAKGSQKP
jgi:DNA-binding NarL/FixJ family response regulator